VDIRISVTRGDLADLESLDDWLRGERELAGRVKLAGTAPHDGELGALSECLVVALGSGGAITVVGTTLAGALKAWLSHPRRSDVRVEVHRHDGTSVEIDAKRVRAGDIDVEATIRQALGSISVEE
jgi:membrane-associated two-gene conflict system component 1 (EACC1)